MIGPLFIGAIFAILLLSGSLFVEDIRAWHDAERRVARCPKRL
jgi:hypothetical protein